MASKTLLVIQSHAEAYGQMKWSWPHYNLPGWDIMGVTPEDSMHQWPPGIRHQTVLGLAGYMTPNLVKRWIETWDLVQRSPEYTDFCMIEPDSVFLRKPPVHPGGMFTHLSGGGIVGGTFKAQKFFHTPWWADKAAAGIIVEEGRKLIAEGEFENGSPDFFLGLISDRRPDLKIRETKTWSCNGGSLGHLRESAEQAIREGAWFLHGLRTPEELRWMTELAAR